MNFRNSVVGYKIKNEAKLHKIFNSYIKITSQSLFPETLGIFW